MSYSCNPLAYGPMDYGDYSPHGLFFCLWNSPSRNTWLGCHFMLQGIFSIQESNPGLLHCRQNLYWLSYEGNCKNQLYSNQKKKKKEKASWMPPPYQNNIPKTILPLWGNHHQRPKKTSVMIPIISPFTWTVLCRQRTVGNNIWLA